MLALLVGTGILLESSVQMELCKAHLWAELSQEKSKKKGELSSTWAE